MSPALGHEIYSRGFLVAEMTPPALGPEIYSRGFRFSPTPKEAVTYYLPRLISGDPLALHAAVRTVIHHADVHACEPAELARRFRPMPRTGDRFFFTPCKNAARAAASPSSAWAAQNTVEIMDKDVRIGELRKLRYKKRGVLTDWLMEEYSSCGGDEQQQFVFCKVYVSPRAAPNSPAHHESAAFFAPPPLPPATHAAVAIAQPAAKRTVPLPPQAAMPPCAPKRTAPTPPQAAMAPCAKRTAPPTPQAAMPPCTKRTAPPPQAAMPPCPKRTAPPPQAAMLPCTKRTAPPPQAAVPPCAKRMRGPVLQPAPRLPAPPALTTTPSFTAVRRMYLAPRQPCAPLRGSPAPSVTHTHPSPAPVQAPTPPVPTRPAVEPRRSPMAAPPRPPLAWPKQQVPLPTPPVVRASHMPGQSLAPARRQPQVSILSKAAMMRQEAEERRVAAGPDPPPSKQSFPAAAPAFQDDDDNNDDLVKDLEAAMSTAEAEEQTVASALQDEDEKEDENDWDDLARELELEIEE